MKVHRTIEEEWQSFFRDVLVKNGIPAEAAPGLRQIFFSGAGSVLSMAGSVPLMKLAEEIMAFHASMLDKAGSH